MKNASCFIAVFAAFVLLTATLPGPVNACTGITLIGADGTVVFGRTCEWGAFDLKSRLAVIPRGLEFVGHTPDGKPGIKWKTKYGVVVFDGLEKNAFLDGMNETGLTVGLFYHPGFAQYQPYDPAKANVSLAPEDVALFILTRFSSIEEVRAAMSKVRVVPVVEPALGKPIESHFIVTDPAGKSIVIEFKGGKLVIFDNPLGVITNSPTFDWHLTNLRNYVNLSPVAIPGKKIEELEFAPLGGGSGMIGLPGDFTPPSRFVRAVAWSQTARPSKGGLDTANEVFRILDNFNVGIGSAEGSDASAPQGKDRLLSATQWTTAWDTKNRVLYYHTQDNRRVRKVDLKAIDFDSLKGGIVHIPLNRKKGQDIEDITPKK